MEKKIESMRRFGHITMWCPLIISMVLGILAILVSILGTANPFFYTFSNVPELYALETGGPFGGIKVAVISIVIGFAFTVAGAILSCIAELMDGYSYVEETEEEEKEEKKPVEPMKEMEEPKQEEKAHDNFVESHEEKVVEPVTETSEDETSEDEPEEEAEEDVNYQEMRHAYDDVDVSIPVVEHEETEEQIAEEAEPVEEKQVDAPEEAEQDETEEAEEEGQYICPTFKTVYSELPKGYQIKRGDMKRDPEVKGMLHFRINGHYFKTTASGDIYDDEPWD